MTAVLSCRQLSVRFGGVKAVVDVDLDVGAGQLVGLIGPNGAGKTTCIDALTGFVSAGGTVTLDGRDVSRLGPHIRAQRGLARTWQSIELFEDLTVGENLAVAADRPSTWQALKQLVGATMGVHEAVARVLTRLGLESYGDALPAELSQGQRKLVGVARALVADPHVVCLDEPAAGLNTWESEQLGRQLRMIADTGTAILLVDHDMGLVLGISDAVVVLETGRVIARGAPKEVRSDEGVITAYLGAAAAAAVTIETGGAASSTREN